MTLHNSYFASLMFFGLASLALAQSAGTSTIGGTVTDSQGAVVTKANVTAKEAATALERSTSTSGAGQYFFGNLLPGVYDVSVELPGFRKAVVNGLKLDVAIGLTQNFTLEVGAVQSEVVVSAVGEAALQTVDSSIGNVVPQNELKLLPNLNRQAGSLLQLQPGATSTGEVTGSRNDQTSIALDGADVTDALLGQAFRTIVPTPTESIDEYRVIVANPNATLGRGAGAQTVLQTKRGTDTFHGSLYEYFQNEDLNANRWQLNRTGQKRPILRDNRFGGTVGGPIFKNKTFFFFNYEGRRQNTNVAVTRVVPSDTLKQGLLRFRDPSGTIQTVDPKAFDPRGLGASPAILKYLALFPAGNDPSAGGADGLNTVGLTTAVQTPITDNFGLLRLDHSFSDKWTFDGSARFARTLQTSATQVDIVNRKATRMLPVRGHFLTGAVTGVLTPQLTNRSQFTWTQDRQFIGTIDPAPLVGLNVAISPSGINAPIDVDTQRARTQFFYQNYYEYNDILSWQKSSHQIQAGATIRQISSAEFRNDKVVGSLTTPVASIAAGQFNIIPASQRPTFLASSDVGRYNGLYSTLLGLVDNVAVLGIRDSKLQPLPPGTGLHTNVSLRTYEFFGQDSWKLSPSFTVSYGLSYQWQTPPVERDGHQTLAVYAGTKTPIQVPDYLAQKRAAAEAGTIFNPDIAYYPVGDLGRDTTFNIDRTNFSPRVSAAWNPHYAGGLLGTMLGDGKTVIRGGYGYIFDRANIVTTAAVPALGVGFGQTITLQAPKNAAGQPFRVGVDGPIPVPSIAASTSPVIPSKPFGELLSFAVDPGLRIPHNHVIDFSVQRELPWKMVLEASYVGRFARNLFENSNLNSVPYFFKDPKSGQTFAQAFDAVAHQLRAGVAPGAVTP